MKKLILKCIVLTLRILCFYRRFRIVCESKIPSKITFCERTPERNQYVPPGNTIMIIYYANNIFETRENQSRRPAGGTQEILSTSKIHQELVGTYINIVANSIERRGEFCLSIRIICLVEYFNISILILFFLFCKCFKIFSSISIPKLFQTF